MAETLNSEASIALGNVPDIGDGSSEAIYEALLRVHAAVEILISYFQGELEAYVTIIDDQVIEGKITFQDDVTLADAVNLIANTITGSKIGISASQKLGKWGVTPVVQPSGANQAALTNSTGGTYDGTLAAIVGSGDDANINNNFTELHTLLNEIRSALVAGGNIKGSA